jgi:hypothetical protein
MSYLRDEKLILITALKEIEFLELPCYATVSQESLIYSKCDEEELCDACKTLEIVHNTLVMVDKDSTVRT